MEPRFKVRREHYLNQPYEVSVETYTRCNATCVFCPSPTLQRTGEKMSDELIDKIITEISSFEKPFYFSPFKVNEPLLDKRLFSICKKVVANSKAILRIFTNGAPLTQKKIDQIAELNSVGHLWISLNSHKPQEYQSIMGIPFEKTAKRLDNLHSQDFPHPVVLSSVSYPNPAFELYCAERWPKFQTFVIKQDSWLGYVTPTFDGIPDGPCTRWFELSIISSGVVSLCCMDGKAQFSIGDVRENSLLEIYNNPSWRERREKMLSRRVVPVCKTCSY